MIKKKGCIVLLAFCFICTQTSFAKVLNDDIYLQKDEEINYVIKKPNQTNINIEENTYRFIIKKYSIINNSNNNFKIVHESELYNQDDFNLLMSLKKNSFVMSDDTFMYSVCSIVFPPLIVAAIPLLIKDAAKTPFKAAKNRKEKNQQKLFKQSLIGSFIPANSEKVIFTLQNPNKPLIPYKLTVQNTVSKKEYTLTEPEKSLKYSEKQDYADKSIIKEQDNPENTSLPKIITKEISIYPVTSTQSHNSKFPSLRQSGNIIYLNKDTVFIAGGKHKYSRETNLNNSNLTDLFNLTYGFRYGAPPQLNSEKINPGLFLLPNNNVLIYGGSNDKSTEIFDVKKTKITPGPSLETDLDNTNSFAFLDKQNNLIIGKTNNNFVEKYNTRTNTIEKINNVNTGAFIAGEDYNYIYFADYNQLSRLNKANLQYEVYSHNIYYPKTNIISTLRLSNGTTLIAEKDEKNLISVYEYNQTNSEKYYWIKNIGTEIQFIHSANYKKGFILAGNYNAILYYLDTENKIANSIASTNFSLKNGRLALAYSSDNSITAIDSNCFYLFLIYINYN